MAGGSLSGILLFVSWLVHGSHRSCCAGLHAKESGCTLVAYLPLIALQQQDVHRNM